MTWQIVDFGKYRGKERTIPWILFHDPDWFFWAYEKGAFRGELARQAEFIYRRATHIRPPQLHKGGTVVEYIVNSSTGGFETFNLIPEDQEGYPASCLKILPVIDMSVPWSFSKRDKLGYRLFLRALKAYLIEDGKNMTEDRCQKFFEDDRNFVL